MNRELWSEVDEYLADALIEPDPVLEQAIDDSDKAGLPSIAVAPNQGKLLYLLARMHTTIEASGEAAGLPRGQMGNSEVGHLTIGSGRRLYQDLMRVNKAIEDGSFFESPVLRAAFADGGAAI